MSTKNLQAPNLRKSREDKKSDNIMFPPNGNLELFWFSLESAVQNIVYNVD